MQTRELCINIIDEAVKSGARKYRACLVLGISLRTLERWMGVNGKEDLRKGPTLEPANKFTKKEYNKIIKTCTSEKYRDLPPTQIVPLLANEGKYIGSESTIYRILKQEKMLTHRIDSSPKRHKKPDEHIAFGPNQVWSWDVTYLKTRVKGQFYYLYMIMDVYSRKIVGYVVHYEDNSENAAILISATSMLEGVDEWQVILHSDNGASQKGCTMLGMLQTLGITPSFSRPSVSNDNPYSESLFKTLKYVPSYPCNGFDNIEEAKEWVDNFVEWYNTKHLHSGIKFVTPEERHLGLDKQILENRIDVYKKAKSKNPNRWSGNIRNWNYVEKVYLNPLTKVKYQDTLEETIK